MNSESPMQLDYSSIQGTRFPVVARVVAIAATASFILGVRYLLKSVTIFIEGAGDVRKTDTAIAVARVISLSFTVGTIILLLVFVGLRKKLSTFVALMILYNVFQAIIVLLLIGSH